MNMKEKIFKVILPCIAATLVFFVFTYFIISSAEANQKNLEAKYPKEYYNQADVNDFPQPSSIIQFEVVQLDSKLDKETIKQMNISGQSFLFIGSISGSYEEKTNEKLNYYGFLRNKNGGIYFSKIPFNKVRIYEDLPEGKNPIFIAYYDNAMVDKNREDSWESYDKFNLHISKNSIIPKINVKFDVNMLK